MPDTNATLPQTARVAISLERGTLDIAVGGAWALRRGWPAAAGEAMARLEDGGARALRVRADGLDSWDTALLSFLRALIERAEDRGLPVERELPGDIEALVRLAFSGDRKKPKDTRRRESLFAALGGAVLGLPKSTGNVLSFIGDVVIALLRFCRGRSNMQLSDVFDAMYECGARSLPIVLVTNSLFGIILAFVGAVQLQNFGAEIYVAGLVGIGMLRILGAVMVGIVMSGRVGAAYAALIGTMQVNEEIDAIETLGISPVDYLVLPRILALAVMVPLLTVFADLAGVLGGLLVSIVLLGLSPMEFISSLVSMVGYGQGIVGLVYAAAFGVIIAISGCYHGMKCGRSAQAVGEATTTAVVHSIVGIIVASAIITVICNVIGV